MRTITMTIQGKKISFQADVEAAVQEQIDLMGNMESNEQAIEYFGSDIPNLADLLKAEHNVKPTTPETKTDKKEEDKTVTETTTTKTPAVHVILPSDLGSFYISKEFLLGTGSKTDANLVKTDKESGTIVVYDIQMMELAAKCSQQVRNAVTKFFEARVEAAKATVKAPENKVAPPSDEPVFQPSKDGKKKAVDFMVQNLKERHEGNWGEHVGIVDKAQWLADFTGHGFRQSTAANVEMTTKGGVLYVHIPGNLYKADREKWNNVLTAIREACRKSRLEYGTVQAGKLPIKIRAMSKNQTH